MAGLLWTCVLICIGLTLTGGANVLHLLPCRGRLVSHRDSFIADQRGAVAFEMLIVYLFLVVSLLLPLADVAVAGFQYISAWEALRAFGQSIQYDPPPDVTDCGKLEVSALANVGFGLSHQQSSGRLR